MAPETIEYRYSHEGRAARGAWTGERAQAVAAAVEHLRAERDEGHGAWTYVAQETGETWRVDEWELAILGAALLALGGRRRAADERGGRTDHERTDGVMANRYLSRHHGAQPAEWFLAQVPAPNPSEERWIVVELDARGEGYECHVGTFPLGERIGAHARTAEMLARMGATVFDSREGAARAMRRRYDVAEGDP